MAGPANAVPLSESLRRVTSQSETERGMHAYKKNLYAFTPSHFGNFGMVGYARHPPPPVNRYTPLLPYHFLIGSAAPGAAKVTKESMPQCSM